MELERIDDLLKMFAMRLGCDTERAEQRYQTLLRRGFWIECAVQAGAFSPHNDLETATHHSDVNAAGASGDAGDPCGEHARGEGGRHIVVAQDTTEINLGPTAGPIAAGLTRPLRRWARRTLKRLKAGPTRAGAWLRRVAQQEPDLFAHWAVTFAGMAER